MIKEKNSLLTVKIIKDKLSDYIPTNIKIEKWAKIAFNKDKDSLVIIKIANKNEIMGLNKIFFKKDKPTNILSFPNNSHVMTGEFILGDIMVCPEIINEESNRYGIEKDKRWAHMIIHSMLHLDGYMHDIDKSRVIMENKEQELMNILGYSDPYYAN
jgi:probable rRNA maturation factor|tara:strand:+ start:1929 stop:2399 length:471 start_codon:yes stop_codon:yes gene_type:complete